MHRVAGVEEEEEAVVVVEAAGRPLSDGSRPEARSVTVAAVTTSTRPPQPRSRGFIVVARMPHRTAGCVAVGLRYRVGGKKSIRKILRLQACPSSGQRRSEQKLCRRLAVYLRSRGRRQVVLCLFTRVSLC